MASVIVIAPPAIIGSNFGKIGSYISTTYRQKNLHFEFTKTTFQLQTKNQSGTWVQAWAWWATNVFT
jgi:hypothetical protein